MRSFFDLAEEHQADILTKWLRTEDARRLDDAMCNVSLRPSFLSLLQTKCVFGEIESGSSPFTWIIRRNIQVRKACLVAKQWTNPDVVSVLCPRLQSLVAIHVEPDEDEEDEEEYEDLFHISLRRKSEMSCMGVLVNLKNRCPSLRTFVLHNMSMCFMWSGFVKSCPLLQEVVLNDCTELSVETVRVCCESPTVTNISLWHCKFHNISQPHNYVSSPQVTTFKLWHTELHPDSYLPLCRSFANLTEIQLSLPGPVDLLIQIAVSCVHVQVANVEVHHTITDSEMAALATAWKKLYHLQLRHRDTTQEVCSQQAVLTLLTTCTALQRLKVCIDDPATFFGSKEMDCAVAPEPIANTSSTVSQLTQLYVDSMSEHTLLRLLSLCPNLHTLAIRHRTEYAPVANTLDTAHTIPAEFVLHHLNSTAVRTLHIVNCSTLTNAHVSVLCHLTELIVCDAGVDLTNTGVRQVVNNCARLSTLKLCRCIGLTPSIVLPTLQKCSTLRCFYYYTHYHTWSAEGPSVEKQVLLEMVASVFPHVKEFRLN